MIIFLDIDGVLVTKESCKEPSWKGHSYYGFDKKSVEAFNELLKKHNPKVVVSSTWRFAYNKKQLQEIFDENGVKYKIYDYTPIAFNARRGHEIEEWLNDNKTDEPFIIIDDDLYDIKPYFESQNILHLKNGFLKGGFKKKHIKEIENKLKGILK